MIAVIGAGITGLVLGHVLDARGIDHVILERATRAGGTIHTAEADGHILDVGPQRTRLVPTVRRLVGELELEGELLLAPAGLPLLIFRDGRLRTVPLSAAGLATTDLLSAREKARLLLEPFTAPHHSDESVARYFTRRFGRAAYLHVLGPLFGGLYASDPERMPVRYALAPLLRESGIGRSAVLSLIARAGRRSVRAPACSFRTGMRAVPDALYARIRRRVRLDTRVVAVTPTLGRFEIETADGGMVADHVVLTTDAAAAAAVLAHAAPAAAERLARLRYNEFAVVHLLADCPLRGMGYQVSYAERLATRGVTFNHSLFARNGVYTAFLGGAREPEVTEHDDAALGDIAVREFHEVTGCDARVLLVSRVSMPAWDDSWSALDGLELPAGVHLCANYESRAGIPGRIARARALAESLID